MVVDTKLYDVLGISANATEKEISTAFRNLSKKYHPDKCVDENKEEATRKFQEINEANSILSDTEKRKTYDQCGLNGVKNATPQPDTFQADFFNMFSGNMFNGFNPFQNQAPPPQKKINDVLVKKTITLEQLYNEETITFEYPHTLECSKCGGTGADDGKKRECYNCGGKGNTVRIQQNGFMTIQNIDRCNQCNATGFVVDDKNKCKSGCNEGFTTTQQSMNLKLSKIYNNYTITHILKDAKIIVLLDIENHPVYKREDNHLICKLEIDYEEALYGFKKNIQFLDKTEIEISSNELIQPNTIKYIEGKGFGDGGNLYVMFVVVLKERIKPNYENNLKQCSDVNLSNMIKNKLL